MDGSIIEVEQLLHVKHSAFSDHIYIRPSGKEDYNLLKELFEISFPVKYDDNFYSSLCAKYYKGRPLNVWIAECVQDGEYHPVGCIVMQERPLDGSPACDVNIVNGYMYNYVLYILNIAVFPEYKRRGIGSLLLQKTIAVANQDELCAGVYLHVLATNEENILFYEHNGFKFVQEFPDFYDINGKWENSKLFFYSLHGATPGYYKRSNSYQLTTVVLAVVFLSLIVLSGYKAIKKWSVC